MGKTEDSETARSNEKKLSGPDFTRLRKARLRRLRIQNGWTQKEVAFRTGIPADVISHYELGSFLPNRGNMQILAKLYGVSLDYLYGISENAEGSDLPPESEDHTLGELLRELREARGLTAAEASRRLGISQTILVKYENGLLEKIYEKVRAMAELYGVTVDFLYDITYRSGAGNALDGCSPELLELCTLCMSLPPVYTEKCIDMLRAAQKNAAEKTDSEE